MIQLQVCFCLLGLALAALGVAMLLRPQRLRRFLRRLDARLWKWTGRRLAWSRLAGSGLLLLGTVLFLVLLALARPLNAMLMGDSWLQTILRVVTPNALSSLIEVFSYYFINSMVTISALIFIAGARTMVLTTMIKQLQYVNRFNEVFVLSLLILATNLIAKGLFSCLASYKASHPVKERRSIQLFGNRKEAVQ